MGRRFQTLDQAFWSKIIKTDTCWNWTGQRTRDRYKKEVYGTFCYLNKKRSAHRFSYEIQKGPIPEDKEIDHKCRNVLCVNPDHLEAVTHQVNIDRSITQTRTVCKKAGHPLPGGGGKCQQCRDEYVAQWQEKNKERVSKMAQIRYTLNTDEMKKKRHEYYHKNKAKVLARQRQRKIEMQSH